MRLPLGVYKTVLLEIPTKIMSCLAAASEQADKGGESKSSAVSPLKLADFLTDSYRMGAVCIVFSADVFICVLIFDSLFFRWRHQFVVAERSLLVDARVQSRLSQLLSATVSIAAARGVSR
jgi:hypothetical protein